VQQIMQRSILGVFEQHTLVLIVLCPAEQFDNVRVVDSGQMEHFTFKIEFAVTLKQFYGRLDIFLKHIWQTCRPLSPLHFIHGAKMAGAHLAVNSYFGVHSQPFIESIEAI